MKRQLYAAAVALGAVGFAAPAAAVDIEDVGGETLSVKISNTTEFAYRFDNRNDPPVTVTNQTLNPDKLADDNYGEWYNRLYLRTRWWRLGFGLRLDSAVYFNTLSREDVQDLILEDLGRSDLGLENTFGRELHNRYSSVIYPAKLWLDYRQPEFEATLGDFYAHLGRGFVFSVRKIDELGVDTTVRGGKLSTKLRFGDIKLNGMLFGGQLNPIRIDYPTGRILTGSGSPLFFLFPRATDFEYYSDPTAINTSVDRARPAYLEDNVIGGNIEVGGKHITVGVNAAVLIRQSNSLEQLQCRQIEGRPAEDCAVDDVVFSTQEASRAHDQIRNFSTYLRIPQIADTVDGYVELAGQQLAHGRVLSLDAAGEADERVEDLNGYALYANINISRGPVTATLEGKHFRSFFPLGSNVDLTTPAFGAAEFALITYSQPPTAESVYVEPIGSRDVCVSGGRARVDGRFSEHAKVYGWVGHSVSFSEADASNNRCETDDEFRTTTWDTAIGLELEGERGKSHAEAWTGLRHTNHAEPHQYTTGESTAFYREGYVRYDLTKHIYGDFSLTSQGFHRHRYEPGIYFEPWWEGENYLALNWHPHLAFIFGYEYLTREGFPTHYFSGALQYRSKSSETIFHQIFDTVRVFVGQRRAAQRCVGGTCRLFPAFEGAKLELVSRF